MPDKVIEIPHEINQQLLKWADESFPEKEGKELQQLTYAVAGNMGCRFGYSLAIKELEGKQNEIERLKELLREVCVRSNIIFPEQEDEIDMFDEQFKNQYDLFINIGATLRLGEIDEESKTNNAEILKKIQSNRNL